MSQNQEIIEAKLCAYVDGELDPDGRAEIEKHLEANPQHRRLLESLRATRDLLKWLPREPAPPELAETLNGQLERSVLLDDDQETSQRHVFPRILAAAAIIVLTAGLAAAVFFALPKAQRNVVAIRGAGDATSHSALSAGTPVGPSTLPLSLDERLHQDGAPADKVADQENSVAAASPVARAMDVGKRLESQESREELEKLANQVTQNSAAYWANDASVLRNATEPLNHALVVLVRSNNPDGAQRQLTQYLRTNGIQWKPAEPANLNGQGAPEGQQSPTNSAAANRADNVFDYKDFGAQPPSSQPAQVERRLASQSPSVQQTAPAEQAENVLERAPAQGNNLYVARMSRRQAAQLTTCISRAGTQTAQLTDPLGGSAADSQDQREGRSKLEMVARTADETEEPKSPTTMPSLRDRAALREVEAGIAPTAELKQKAAAARGGGLSAPLRAGVESTPTTQPASAAMPEDEQPVDVVIVVQPNEASGPATLPSAGPQTQPAAPTPAQ